MGYSGISIKISLIITFLLISFPVFSQKRTDNSLIFIDRIKTRLANEQVKDFFFYSINCYADVVSVDENPPKISQINEFSLYCFWIKNNEYFVQKFDNRNNNFNELNISKAIKIEKFEGFKIISGNFEKIRAEKVLDAQFNVEGEIVTIDQPGSCITKFTIFNDKETIDPDFISFKIDDKRSINYKKNNRLNIAKLYHQCEMQIDILNNRQNALMTIQKEKISE